MADPASEVTLEIAIRTQDAERMVRFYLEVLGGKPYGEVWLDERPKAGKKVENLPGHPIRHRHYWGISLGGGIVKLLHDAAPLDPANPQYPHANRYGISEHVLHTPDAKPIFAKTEAFGGQIEVPFRPFPPSVNRPGGYGYIRDPDGNRIEIIEGHQYSAPSEEFKQGRAWKSREDMFG